MPLEGEDLDREILRFCRKLGEVSLADLCLEVFASRDQIRERLQVLKREDLLTASNAQDRMGGWSTTFFRLHQSPIQK